MSMDMSDKNHKFKDDAYDQDSNKPQTIDPFIHVPPAFLNSSAPPILLSDQDIANFIVNGFLVIQTGLPLEFHQALYAQAETINTIRGKNPGNNILPSLPSLSYVFNSPNVKGALQSLLGNDYMMHPHRYSHTNPPGFPGQKFHRDSYWGYLKWRHHVPMMVMAMYYPQQTPLDLGPTNIVPKTQYLTRRSSKDRFTEKMPEEWKVQDLPLVCLPGAVVIIHYDIWHKGTPNEGKINRYMFKFQFLRMNMPIGGPSWKSNDDNWPLQSQNIIEHPLLPLWTYVWHWMKGRGIPETEPDAKIDSEPLCQALFNKSLEGEVDRLSASYALASKNEYTVSRLSKMILHSDESIHRSVGYGLSSTSNKFVRISLNSLVSACTHQIGKIRANAVFFIGEVGIRGGIEGIPAVMEALNEADLFVRRNASESIGNILAWIHGDVPIPNLENIVKKLCEVLLNDEDDQVKFQMALSIGRSAKYLSRNCARPLLDLVVESLCLVYQKDTNRYTKAYSLDALQRISTPSALRFVLDSLWTSRWCAITSPSTPF